MTKPRWIARARAGEAAAFRHLVDANARRLFRVCARITGDRTLTQDAVCRRHSSTPSALFFVF